MQRGLLVSIVGNLGREWKVEWWIPVVCFIGNGLWKIVLKSRTATAAINCPLPYLLSQLDRDRYRNRQYSWRLLAARVTHCACRATCQPRKVTFPSFAPSPTVAFDEYAATHNPFRLLFSFNRNNKRTICYKLKAKCRPKGMWRVRVLNRGRLKNSLPPTALAAAVQTPQSLRVLYGR